VGDYRVEIKASARRELEALPDSVLGRVLTKVEALSHAPRPIGCKKLNGYTDLWRVRIGDWRVVYLVDDKTKFVSITRIAHRSEVYER
jgi:mRNA interferase RelE/StbE